MTAKKVTAIYFSPTKGTREYVCAIAKELDAEYTEINLTDREERAQEHFFGPDELVVIGAPVYYGRIPQVRGGLFGKLHGENTPALFVVSYGNRAFEDALLELSDYCARQGFFGMGAGAFIAPHTFSARIGEGRPDEKDRKAVACLAEKTKECLESGKTAALELPGNRPYREFQTVPFAPKGAKACNQCGVCVRICPAGAISKDNPRNTDKASCIRCLACVKECPQKARSVGGPVFAVAVKQLEGKLMKTRREPELFFAEKD